MKQHTILFNTRKAYYDQSVQFSTGKRGTCAQDKEEKEEEEGDEEEGVCALFTDTACERERGCS